MVGRVVATALDYLDSEVGIAAGTAVDRGQRLCCHQDQWALMAGQDRAQRLVHSAAVSRHGGMFARAFPAHHIAAAFGVATPTERMGRITRQAWHLDFMGRQVCRNLDQSHGAHADHQQIGVLRKGYGSQQGLQVEAVRNLDQGSEAVWQAKAADILRRRKKGEAIGLFRPKIIIANDRLNGLLHGADAALRGPRSFNLGNGGFQQIFQLDPVGLRILRQRGGRQIDRDCRTATIGRQLFYLVAGRQIDVEHSGPLQVSGRGAIQ